MEYLIECSKSFEEQRKDAKINTKEYGDHKNVKEWDVPEIGNMTSHSTKHCTLFSVLLFRKVYTGNNHKQNLLSIIFELVVDYVLVLT